jgi:hypothetical protein
MKNILYYSVDEIKKLIFQESLVDDPEKIMQKLALDWLCL